MRESVPVRPPLTQTALSFAATPTGPSPAGITFTETVPGSMRDTVPSRRFATQTKPPPTAIALGPLPTWIGGRTVPERAAILVTLFPGPLTTQTNPKP